MKNVKKGVAITLVLLALLVAVRVLLPLLPAPLTQYDVSDNGLYSISTTTKSLLRSLDEDVTIYVIGSGGGMSFLNQTLLGRYEAASRHIHVRAVDLSVDTDVAERYGVAASLSAGSMIVQSARRYTVVDADSVDYTVVNGAGSLPTSQYSQLMADQTAVAYYAYYGIDLSDAARYLALEQALTLAVERVTMPTVPHIYATSANGERVVGQLLQTGLDQTMLEYETLDLTEVSAVPADAASLLILAPETDFSDEVTERILAYIAKGGHVLLVSEPANATMPNLARITAAFGLCAIEGELLEGNANRYVSEATNAIASVNGEHDVTYAVYSAGYYPVMPHSHGIDALEEVSQTLTVTPLFALSDATYVQRGEETEQIGSTVTGAAVSDSQGGAMLFWMSSADAVQDDFVLQYGPGALYYLTQAALWQSVEPTSALDAIEPVALSEQPMLFTDTTALLWAGVAIILVPLGLLVAGITVRIKRERR